MGAVVQPSQSAPNVRECLFEDLNVSLLTIVQHLATMLEQSYNSGIRESMYMDICRVLSLIQDSVRVILDYMGWTFNLHMMRRYDYMTWWIGNMRKYTNNNVQSLKNIKFNLYKCYEPFVGVAASIIYAENKKSLDYYSFKGILIEKVSRGSKILKI